MSKIKSKQVEAESYELEIREEEELKSEELNPDEIDKHYTYPITHSKLAIINHNLNKKPAVQVEDSDGEHCIANIKHIDLNNTRVEFEDYFTGKITFN